MTSLISLSDLDLPAIFFEMIGPISICILVTSKDIFKVIVCHVIQHVSRVKNAEFACKYSQ